MAKHYVKLSWEENKSCGQRMPDLDEAVAVSAQGRAFPN